MRHSRRRDARTHTVLGSLAILVAFATAGAGALPAAATTAPEGEVHGLRGDYMLADRDNGFELGDPVSSVLDAEIDYQNLLPIYEHRTGRSEDVGVRWSGSLTVPEDGDYTFHAIGDNGFRLRIDGELLIDFWEDQWEIEKSSPSVALKAGEEYPFVFENFQAVGGANVHLSWSGPGIDHEIVPLSAFTPPDDFETVGISAAVSEDGTTVTGTSGSALAAPGDLAEHVSLWVDGGEYPVAAGSVSGATLVVRPAEPIARDVAVRLSYDGEGGLTASGEAVGAFDLPVRNDSQHQLTTPWAGDVDPGSPLPEYPRPQLVRDEWLNLNGRWEFQALSSGEQVEFGQSYDEEVLVPYPIESILSGLQRHEDDFAYRRTFQVPDGWGGQRILLQFGAVDYEARVYVNGAEVAHHTGGYDAFSADITDALAAGENELVVRVTDTTRGVPRGKQEPNPSGIFYTASSGIWQTVWLEPVPATSITEIELTPDLDASALRVTVETDGDAEATVRVLEDGAEVATATGAAGTELELPITDPRLWSPDDPFLYDLEVTATDGMGTDAVRSYAGMRSIEVAEVDGVQRILLNGEQTYLLSTLDQGYWPDGVSTAPTDEALAWDIAETKELGFNTIRKHIKVEPARWYYHADRLGMLVWQDMPANNGGNGDEAQRGTFRSELDAMVDQLDAAPSIIGWVPFNEGWGEWDRSATGEIADHVGELDPTRLVNAHSGVNCCNSKGDSGRGDVIDWHEYANYGPALPRPDATRAAIDGEHGGYSLSILGHVWPGGSVNPYGEVETPDELTAGYVENTARLIRPAQEYLSGSVYTQLTDVEGEVNGFWTYDRRVLKVDTERVAAINRTVIEVGSAGRTFPEPIGGDEGLARWELDEGEGGKSADATGGGHELTLHDGASWTDGVDGSALELNGDRQSATAQVPELDTTADYTISAWVRLDSLPANYASFVSGDGLTGRSTFFLQYGAPVGGFAMSFADGPRAVAELTPETGEWYHLVGVRDAQHGTLSLYLDGELAATVDTRGGTASNGTIALGRAQWDGSAVDFLDGALDQVRVFDRALADDEVAALFAGEPEEPVEQPDPWDADTVYDAGDAVSHDGSVWRAAWWTQNQEPGDPNGPWQEIAEAEDGTAMWTPSRIFTAGDVVVHDGATFRAKWWTRNQEPGDPNGPWQPTD